MHIYREQTVKLGTNFTFKRARDFRAIREFVIDDKTFVSLSS